ncbi:type IV pilus assembly protein PilC [Deinococcus radiodurans]|jgi:Type II secretory pathway, component PulF|uniref:Pilin biogenesis protein n=1 Tax=Deinococcus radiodurans (strain ATCC 13939 / DSM 20539 / JCM 16871 / CCUG 27074 / LMG 4051 / NBRC 15346 / NCIMB 9279 / VKM B-1422 / R1) TaxID=243230 RepID=Q9RTA2_DEIRA|nr:type II secretion system F family protein [Deinococcus radiodurans]AAF11416.1 pilin biogenesis protein [Deinococcus radiodurans R1 = ATCC 13939 = DSM 20539]ANC71046.1 phytochrome sensor protein [Deinococcus radiodurans R1 = ATCC 13939 = DSM 20539]QEM71276.1 type II secretion system F family protein [Deinococcus radiodurans]UDL00928.1 type II secretion system F family protein [Deinococcus radiodurans R1 = ATCC 13939 = DSM 20539]UID70835.1 phytochrome sensor protein [Deinococcus radiodurans R
MPVYEYRARDRGGQTLKSQMEADSEAQVRDALRARNLMILEIKAPKTGLNADIKIPGLTDRPPGLKQVAVFSKQLATLINAGVPLVQSLAILQRQLDNKTFEAVIKKVRGEVESGQPLSEALQQHPKIFGRLFINLVRAGETSGTLDTVLERIADFQEKQLALQGKIKSALTYPTVVLVFALGITYFLLTTVVPQFAGILTQLNAPLPFITRMLMAVSNFLQHSGLLLLAIIAVIVLAYRWYYRTPQGRHAIDDFKLRLPVFGNLIQKSAISSFARTFGLLVSSGVNIIESLEITKGTADNAIVEETIENAKNVVISGDQMSSSLATSKVFPPMVVSMVAIGEETGSLDNMLNKVADFYDREVDEAVESLTAAIEPMMIVFLGGIVGLIVAGMFLPMFSIIGTLSQ